MPVMLHEVTIDTSPERVFKAITEQEGLAGWWTPDIVAEPKVGSTIMASFGHGRFFVWMEVVNLEPDRKVEWVNRKDAPKWLGTHVIWDLSPVGKGTKILFGHLGWASADDAFQSSSSTWSTYLISLKDYLEKGKGNPDFLYRSRVQT